MCFKVGSHTGSRAERDIYVTGVTGARGMKLERRDDTKYSPTVTRKGAEETRTTERGEDTVTVKNA
jgi:hypothetical protein